MPTFDFDAAMTRASRVQVEKFVDPARPADERELRKAPEFYD